MAYTPSYEALTRRRRLTDAAIPGQGLLQSGADADTLGEYAGRRAKELETSYRARDLERGMADLDARGALYRREQRYAGEGEAERFLGATPMREAEVREREWNAAGPHQRQMEIIGRQNEGRAYAPYLNYLGKTDATAATRERTKAQYGDPMAGDPDAAENGSGGFFGAIGSLLNRVAGGKKPAAAAPAPVAQPGAGAAAVDDGGQDYDVPTLVGELKRAYPNASPRDLVAILNEEVDGDPQEIEAATRLILGLR